MRQLIDPDVKPTMATAREQRVVSVQVNGEKANCPNIGRAIYVVRKDRDKCYLNLHALREIVDLTEAQSNADKIEVTILIEALPRTR